MKSGGLRNEYIINRKIDERHHRSREYLQIITILSMTMFHFHRDIFRSGLETLM